MDWNHASERIAAIESCDPVHGQVRWAAGKSLWIGSMTTIALVCGPATFSIGALLLFLATTAVTLCAGHSVGVHRRLIHNSFECPRWLEYTCVYLGVLVGMAGPLGIIVQHDLRDWAQRQPDCHPFLRHGRPFFIDAWWQLHCDLHLDRAPTIRFEPRIAHDRFYRGLEATWPAQQIPVALVLFAIGGWGWVVWGVCMRVAVSVTGHWLVGHFAHRRGPMTWEVRGAGVQGHNVPFTAWLSMGESWHNNHHAFPGSARLGLLPHESDPGWWLIQRFARCGWAWSIKTPEQLAPRAALLRLSTPTRAPGLPDARK